MRRRLTLIVVLVLMLVVGLLVAPAVAKKPAPVGDRINVFTGTPTTFDPDTPFHIMHGWALEKGAKAVGVYDFELQVDGVFVDEDFRLKKKGEAKSKVLWWVHNFADGYPDGSVVTFTGTWYAPCQAWEPDPADCPTPNARIEAFTNSLTVTFSAAP